MAEVQAYSEKVMRANLSKLPDGEYTGEDFTDGLRLGDEPIPIRVRVTIAGDEATVDLSESADQVGGPINAPVASTRSAVYTFFVNMMSRGTPVNDGSYRPITVIARKGSICNPHFPAPVRSRMATCYRIMTTLKHAFANASSDLVAAAGDDSTNSVAFAYQKDEGYKVSHEILGGGNGATKRCDGADGIAQALSNCANTPIEALEVECEAVRVLSYGLIPDSGGPGCFRGGLGIERTYEVLMEGVTLCTAGDRQMTPPWGFGGGGSGSPSTYTIVRDGKSISLGVLTTMTIRKGDIVVARTSGGGGFGDPRERPRDAVRQDLAKGYIGPDSARDIYGYNV